MLIFGYSKKLPLINGEINNSSIYSAIQTIAMSIIKVKLNPDLEKLKTYLGEWHFKTFTKQRYAQLELALSKDQYKRYSDGLKGVIEKYKLQEVCEELLYVIFKEDEVLGDNIRNDQTRYDYLENIIDVSKFLLAFKNSQDNPHFQIGIKENTGTENIPINKTYFVKNAEISKWMCQVICDAIEVGNLPYGLVDEQSTENIFGSSYYDSQAPIKVENLERGANLKNKSFSVYRRKRYVEFCYEVKNFLEEYTNLKSAANVKVSDEQANFFFDILSVLDYLNFEKIESDPKDYINSMIRNHNK
ncbi:hypothetical protein [Pedobacter borealis]|uniref:hypothetical protein n=1 Tax=Pedobacter borealis TaxID=475254 RepID=UPI0004933ECD|nr:hypothetical protein [Pedobacter borealis]